MYLGPELNHVVSVPPQPANEEAQCPLAASVLSLVSIKRLALLVHRVVCEVHETLVLHWVEV